MEPLAILSADPLDLLFDNRNKKYGAYTLRKYYDRRLALGLSASLSAGILFFSLLTFGSNLPAMNVVEVDGSHFLLPPVAPPAPVKPVFVPARVVHMASVNDSPPVITPDKLVVKPVHTIAELADAHLGEADLEGPPDKGLAAVGPADNSGSAVSAPEKLEKPVEPEVYGIADVMPQYPGGQKALQRFLIKNLRIPEGVESGTRVNVLATFVIGAEGKLTRVNMTRSGGTSFDAEVRRVLAKMPLWIPGRMGTRTVPVYFSLPVQFLVPEN